MVAAVTEIQAPIHLPIQTPEIGVTITFHGPFRIATGTSSDGLDATYRTDNPLPASSLKGLMRHQTAEVLGVAESIVAEIYGKPHVGSPWWWSDAAIEDGRHMVRTLVRIDSETGTATPGALRTVGELWPISGRFTMRRRGLIEESRLPLHRAVLAASARAVTALGADRRRGLGWVTLTPDQPWDAAQRDLLMIARSGHG
jgi:CRISPR/Cas system CSM-associated protein Csm3 (group 7 of RAMP superfamily)